MSASLNDLPDLCLLAVFRYLPLLSLLGTIRLVSTRWSSLLPTELNRRRSLVIVDDRTFDLSRLQLDQYGSRLIEHVRRDDALTPWARLPHIDHRNVINRNNRYQKNVYGDFRHDQVPPEMITSLIDNLPKINSLTVVKRFADFAELSQIIRMIDHWRGELVSLKIYLKLNYANFLINAARTDTHVDHHKAQLKASTLALFDSINRATSLKHLAFKFDSSFLMNRPFEPPLTILSQLRIFHIESFVLDNFPSKALVRYASDNRDIQIATVDYKLKLKDLLEIDQQFCDKFIDVEVGVENKTIRDFNRFCTRFSSLVHLTLVEFDLPMTRLAQCLSQLNQLVHLSLHVYMYPLFEEDNELEVLEELPLDQIVTVPSVRLLSLILNTRSHHFTEQLHLPELFPNVQVFSFRNVTEECPDCGFVVDQMTGNIAEITPQMRRCAQLARRPFRHFPLLHTIEIDANDSAYLSASSNDRKFITRDEL